jgi:hypothetical protein
VIGRYLLVNYRGLNYISGEGRARRAHRRHGPRDLLELGGLLLLGLPRLARPARETRAQQLGGAIVWETALSPCPTGPVAFFFPSASRACGSSTSTRNCLDWISARAGNRRFRLLSALGAHTEAPYRTDLLWETRRALKRLGRGGPSSSASRRRSSLSRSRTSVASRRALIAT